MALPHLNYSPPQAPINVLHRDEALLVINKPAGLLSVPGKDKAHRECVETRLQDQLGITPRIVHRLDMDTSGVMVLALDGAAHRHLGLQFERRHIKKTYHAKVLGCPVKHEGTIALPLRCDWPNRPKQMGDFIDGKSALTRWKVIEKSNATLLQLTPETGRSHQLRVHLLALGHPILGDRFYAPQTCHMANRLMLHASHLALRHPNGGAWMYFDAPHPFSSN